MKKFSELKIAPSLLSVISDLGFTEMTPIQEQSLPLLLAGKDLIGQSQTGSGKTIAFALPILQNLQIQKRQLQALVIAPTRELCAQVARDIRKLGRNFDGLHVLPLVGGAPARPQMEALKLGAHIAVGTPGRILDLLGRGGIELSDLKTLVFDEADKMLEMGFEDEISSIMKLLPQKRQTIFFSATFPSSVLGWSEKYQKNPVRLVAETSETAGPDIQQILYDTILDDKLNTLMRVLQQHPAEATLIFCNQKITVAQIGDLLLESQVTSIALHGDLDQRERNRAIALFRNGSHRILIATDIAARGLDIEQIELVINFDLPVQPEIYVHRIGRTGRAGRSGTAVSLAMPHEALKIFEIEQLTGIKLEKPKLGFKNQHSAGSVQQAPTMQTLAISGGRKDKLRPGDILGALTSSPQGLLATEVGKIEIHDRFSYVAVLSSQSRKALEKLRLGKIKGSKYKVSLVK